MQYLPYKIGSFCTHDSQKSSNTFVDLICNRNQHIVHRVSQFGRFCNKCAAIITKSVSNLEDCLCCQEALEEYLADRHLCQHQNRTIDEIMVKCLDQKGEFHEIPFKSKVCEQCFTKIRAGFMYSQRCVICAEKEEEIFQNLEKTLTLPAHYYYETIVDLAFKNKMPDQDIKKQIEQYCLAEPITIYDSKLRSQVNEVSQNLPAHHQSKRYQLYPKCPKHKKNPISVCNNCLVGILNIERCPYGCPYKAKQKTVGKAENVKISECGFICMYPKSTKSSQYLELFVIRLIDEVNRLNRWESSLKKIRLAQSCKINLKQLFTLYANTIQITPNSYLFTGGSRGPHIYKMESIPDTFIIQITKNRKQFTIEKSHPMLKERSSHSLVKVDDFVYAIGGFNTTKKYMNDCERYNIKKDKWEPIPPMKVQRSKANCFYYKGFLYVFGGLSANPEISIAYGQRYNIEKGIWEVLNYQGYSYPFLTGATLLNNHSQMPQIDNILLIGGTDYQSMTCLVQQIAINGLNFRMNPSALLHKLQYNREGASIGIMNSAKNQKTIIVFGGLEEYQPVLNFDAMKMKISQKEGRSELIPFFVYDDIQTGSYRLLLRQNTTENYEYMFNVLVEQKILDKGKMEKDTSSDIFKSQFNVHLVEKMWYGIGKNIVSITV